MMEIKYSSLDDLEFMIMKALLNQSTIILTDEQAEKISKSVAEELIKKQ